MGLSISIRPTQKRRGRLCSTEIGPFGPVGHKVAPHGKVYSILPRDLLSLPGSMLYVLG